MCVGGLILIVILMVVIVMSRAFLERNRNRANVAMHKIATEGLRITNEYSPGNVVTCPKCNMPALVAHDYCPSCGAKLPKNQH